jgi:hypothetical protein
MTNVAGQRIEPAVEAAPPLVEMGGAEKVYRTAKPTYAALRRWTWRSGPGGHSDGGRHVRLSA